MALLFVAAFGLYSCAFMSTLRPRKRTPSASNRNRCSMALSPVSLMAPPAPRTRCQGNPNPRRNTRATSRAAPGKPAARATPPYVDTFPRGIARIARSMRRRIVPESGDFFFRVGIKRGRVIRLDRDLSRPRRLLAKNCARAMRPGGKLPEPRTRSRKLQTR